MKLFAFSIRSNKIFSYQPRVYMIHIRRRRQELDGSILSIYAVCTRMDRASPPLCSLWHLRTSTPVHHSDAANPSASQHVGSCSQSRKKLLLQTTGCSILRDHFPMQNLLNMLLKTSSEMSSPLIVARASAASLKSTVQKSIGNCSLIDDSRRAKASLVLNSCSNCL